MGQKKEKYARRLNDRMSAVEARTAAVERRQMDSDRYISALQDLSGRYQDVLRTQRGRARHEVTAAKKAALRWQINTALALVLLVLVSACCIVYVSAQEPENPQNGPPVQTILIDGDLQVDDTPTRVRCYMAPEEVEAAGNEMITAALLSSATRLNNVTVTHYCTCSTCCGWNTGITASGVVAAPGVTVAVDPEVIPLGADVLVDYGDGEIHYYRADDTGGGVRGAHIDLCMESHEAALEAGVKQATLWWVMPN